jgi:hypothetical protein
VLLPELDAYIPLSSRSRLFLLSAITEDLSRETTVGELGVNLDLTLMPILRRELRLEDWERDRYLWVRVGYRLIGNLDDTANSKAEHRGIFEVTGRFPLLWDVWLVERARVDLRDVGGEFSARFRPRVGLERKFTIGNHALVPYLQVEAFYDTRFGDWSRERYTSGAEYELTEHWRVESYFRRQEDRRPARAHENGVGFVLKYYY